MSVLVLESIKDILFDFIANRRLIYERGREREREREEFFKLVYSN
jgi:hypothetical protein